MPDAAIAERAAGACIAARKPLAAPVEAEAAETAPA
jgi:hypothetical protein